MIACLLVPVSQLSLPGGLLSPRVCCLPQRFVSFPCLVCFLLSQHVAFKFFVRGHTWPSYYIWVNIKWLGAKSLSLSLFCCVWGGGELLLYLHSFFAESDLLMQWITFPAIWCRGWNAKNLISKFISIDLGFGIAGLCGEKPTSTS